MKKSILTLIAIALCAVASAKDIKTLVITPNPQMHCESCENKIKNALRFEKGVKDVSTSIEQQTVTIQYDADKTSEASIVKALAKANYTPVKSATKAAAKSDTTCCKSMKKLKAAPTCCKGKADVAGAKKTCCKADTTCQAAPMKCCKAKEACPAKAE